MKIRTITAALLGTAALAACGASEPSVGACTNFDTKLGVELDVKVVDCGAADATTKITAEAKQRSECKFVSLQSGDTIFCAEPLTGTNQ
jgi:hypothetical protein